MCAPPRQAPGARPHPGAPWPSGAGGRCVCISPDATLSDVQDGGELKSMERLLFPRLGFSSFNSRLALTAVNPPTCTKTFFYLPLSPRSASRSQLADGAGNGVCNTEPERQRVPETHTLASGSSFLKKCSFEQLRVLTVNCIL